MESIVSFYNKKCILLMPLLLRKLENTASNTLCMEYCSNHLACNNRVLTGYSDVWGTITVWVSHQYTVLDRVSPTIHPFHLSPRISNRLAGKSLRLYLYNTCFFSFHFIFKCLSLKSLFIFSLYCNIFTTWYTKT